MSLVRSAGNRSTELRLIALMRTARIRGWRRHQTLPGKPDFVFRKHRLAVFVDGCFWHACPKHVIFPAQRAAFWLRKLANNKARDRRVNRILRKDGWRVVRIWEHDLARRGEVCVRRIHTALKATLPPYLSPFPSKRGRQAKPQPRAHA